MTSSDGSATMPVSAEEVPLAHETDGTPAPANPFKVVPMATGRPLKRDSRARRREMLRLMQEDQLEPMEAAQRAGMKADTVLRLLSEADYRAVFNAILDGRVSSAVVVVEPVTLPVAA